MSSPILPLSGAMRNGAISERPTWAHRTDERASSSSRTETDDDSTDTDPSSIAPWPSSENAPAWPTPAASTPNDGEDPETWITRREMHARHGSASQATRAGMPLAIAAKLWPTATRTDSSASARHGYMVTASRFKRGNPTLGATAIEHQDSRRDRSITKAGIGGSAPVYLHPSFVETLMGFPIGWTVCPRSETLSFLP